MVAGPEPCVKTITLPELWSSNHPSGQRVEDLIEFAKDIYQKYSEKF